MSNKDGQMTTWGVTVLIKQMHVDEYLPVPAWTPRTSLDTHSEGFSLC